MLMRTGNGILVACELTVFSSYRLKNEAFRTRNHAKNEHIDCFEIKALQNIFLKQILIRMMKIPSATSHQKYRYRYASASDTDASVRLSRTFLTHPWRGKRRKE